MIIICWYNTYPKLVDADSLNIIHIAPLVYFTNNVEGPNQYRLKIEKELQ